MQRHATQATNLRLALVGIGSGLCYAAALARFPLLAIYAQPIQDLTKLTHRNAWTGLALAAVVLALFALYGLGALALSRGVGVGSRRSGGRRQEAGSALDRASSLGASRLLLLGFPLAFLAILLLVYPTTSVDLYDYVFRGRMLVRYQANTFVRVPSEYGADPLFWYVAWRRAVTAYGPLWEGLSWLAARLAGEVPGAPGLGAFRDAELLRLMLAYKGLAALGYLLCGGAIWLALRRAAPRWRLLGLYLWLWNPLVLWESLAAGHNDAWMAALIVLAVSLLAGNHEDKDTRTQGGKQRKTPGLLGSLHPSLAAFLALTLGGLVKFLALMFGPALLAAALRRLPGWRARARLALLGGLACAAVVVLAYAPFWAGWGTLRNFGDRGTLFTSSWLAVLQAPLTLAEVKAIVPAPRLLALLFPVTAAQPIAVAVGLALLALGVLWSAWRSWHAPERVAEHALGLLLWFLLLCNPWFQPWYLLWALALLAIQPWRSRLAWGLAVFCCTAMLSYPAGVYLLPALGWNVDGAEWNALITAAIYGPPTLALLWGRRASFRPWRVRVLLASDDGGASPAEGA